MSKELMARMVNAIPEPELMRMIQVMLNNHRDKRTDDTRDSLSQACVMFIAKTVITRDGLEKTIKDLNDLSQLHERFSAKN